MRPEDLRGGTNRALFAALVAHVEAGGTEIEPLEVPEGARALLEELRGEKTEVSDPDRNFWEQVGQIRLRSQLDRWEELNELLKRAEEPDRMALYKELTALKKELKGQSSQLEKLGSKTVNRFRRHLKR